MIGTVDRADIDAGFLIPYKNWNEGKGCLFNVFDIRVFWKYYSHGIFGGRIFTQSFSKKVILPFPNMAETVSQPLKLWAMGIYGSKNSSWFIDILLIISFISCTFPDDVRYAFILWCNKSIITSVSSQMTLTVCPSLMLFRATCAIKVSFLRRAQQITYLWHRIP